MLVIDDDISVVDIEELELEDEDVVVHLDGLIGLLGGTVVG